MSKGRSSLPSIFFTYPPAARAFTDNDRATLAATDAIRASGFDVVLGVARRCAHGFPQVLFCRAMKKRQPFPTIFWLVCPHLARLAGKLEAENGVDAIEEALFPNAAAWLAYHKRHARLRLQILSAAEKTFLRAYRPSMYRALTRGGVGGVFYNGSHLHAKCLHLQIASYLGLNAHPASEWLRGHIGSGNCRNAACGDKLNGKGE